MWGCVNFLGMISYPIWCIRLFFLTQPHKFMIDFNKITDLNSLSLNLGYSVRKINSYVNSKKQPDFYEQFLIPKNKLNNGIPEYRTVYFSMKRFLKNIHKNIDESLKNNDIYKNLPDYVQAFVPGRSIKTNAEKHLAKRFIYKVDIKDFFDSISFDMVQKVFCDLGCNEKISYHLSCLCTIDKVLCQGLNTSPTISNYVCREMDVDLDNLSKKYGCIYTRYSDDITFSSDNALPTLDEILCIFKKYGFKINPKKNVKQFRGRTQYITGLTVFDKFQPRISKKYKRNLRLVLYYLNKFGFMNHYEKNKDKPYNQLSPLQLRGMISFVNSVEPKVGRIFFKQLNDAEISNIKKMLDYIKSKSNKSN